MAGKWRGTYSLKFLRIEMNGLEPKPIYSFSLDSWDPLIYIAPDGTWVSCANIFETDMGSVPAALMSFASPLASPRGYPLHDSAFENHGWWESKDSGRTWVFISKTEHEVNEALCEWCEADGVDLGAREAIHRAVGIAGAKLWNSHPGPFPVSPPPNPACYA